MKVVQARLGHATAAETLDTYSHLWPDAEDRTREAVDTVLLRNLAAPAARSSTLRRFSQVRQVVVTSRPVRRILSRDLAVPVVAIHLGRQLPAVSSGLPGINGRAALSLLGLAPGGVYRAVRVTPDAGALLPHRFTLTCAHTLRSRVRHRRSAFCCTFLRVTPTGCYPAPCPVESGRSSDGSHVSASSTRPPGRLVTDAYSTTDTSSAGAVRNPSRMSGLHARRWRTTSTIAEHEIDAADRDACFGVDRPRTSATSWRAARSTSRATCTLRSR